MVQTDAISVEIATFGCELRSHLRMDRSKRLQQNGALGRRRLVRDADDKPSGISQASDLLGRSRVDRDIFDTER
jgi:hypothetical protein